MPPKYLVPALENIYISPLEICNLQCQLCYTNKTKSYLSSEKISDFVTRYSNFINKSYSLRLKSILFCGGEVFTLPDFIPLINQLTDQKLFISIITNGTIDHLNQIMNPNSIQLLVSLDGPKEIHDANRGQGNFDKSIEFIDHALLLGFHVEIMYLVTHTSYPYVDSFSSYLSKLLSLLPPKTPKVNFITVKSSAYTSKHPLAKDNPKTTSLSKEQIINIKRNHPSIPPKNFGCFQLSLQSNGVFYGCCESPEPIGTLHDSLQTVIKNYIMSFSQCNACQLLSNKTCHGCCRPQFLCGYKQELELQSCTDVVKTFNP